ncbi:MAG: type IV pilus assembly protein PilM [Calditrichota bacterium]
MAKRTKTGIGLDIGSRSVQLAVLRTKKNAISVERIASKELPHDAIVEGLVIDSQVVAERIAELLHENHIKGKEAAISVGGRRVMIKKVATDEMSDDELSATIAYEAKNNLPFDISEVSFDYARLPEDVDTGRMEVLLVAAKNEVVADTVDHLRRAGGKAGILEAEPIALQAALSEAGYLDDESTVAALQIGFQTTDVTVYKRGAYESNRNLNIGGKTYIEALIRDLGIPFEKATGILSGTQRSPDEEAALVRVAQQVSEKIAEQVERSFSEYFGIGAEAPVTKIVMCGGGAHLPMLETTLHQRFGIEVAIADPFRHFEMNVKGMDASAAQSIAPDYTAAVGLALRALDQDHPGFNLLLPQDKPGHKRTQYAGLSTVLPVMGFSVLLFGVVMVYLSQESKLMSLEKQLGAVRKEADLYRDKIALVEELSQKRADIAARMDVISELDRNRFARIKIMQILNNALPPLTWITSVQETGTPRGPGINLSGITSSNLKVSEFMTNLLQTKLVNGVDLLVSEQSEIADVSVTRFTLQVSFPSLGIREPTAAKRPDMLKQGAAAIRERRAAEEKLKAEASK